MTCKACIYYEACSHFMTSKNEVIAMNYGHSEERECFKDKSRYVEVVRCKDCKHWLKDVAGCTEFVGHCEWANWMIGETGYCVYGEADENENI